MNILYLTGGCFPFGSAYASRTLNICRAIKQLGHNVFVVADYNQVSCEQKDSIDGINYYLIDNNREKQYGEIIKEYLSYVEQHIIENKPDLIICASEHDRFKVLYNTVKSNNIPLVLESCEWFGPYNWSYGLLNPRYYKFLDCWHNYYPRVDGVIAISSLLEKHYSKSVKNVIRIPTVLDSRLSSYNVNTENLPIKLIYAGSSGKSKDLLKNLILAVIKLNNEKIKFTVDIYGVGTNIVKKQLGSKKSVLDIANKFIKVHGRVPQEKINELYCSSDYSILLRPQRRSSNAGFPTKLAESMMAGTPVICNDTGDVGMYVKDGVNGFIVDSFDVKTLCNALLRIEKVPTMQKEEIRRNARQIAENNFNYLSYIDELDDFLKKW